MTAAARPYAALGALCGALGLILCAFASHGVSDPQNGFWLRIGGFCLAIQALAAIVALGFVPDRLGRISAVLFLAGGLVFAFSLAAMAFGGPRWLGAVTPFGGLSMILGWVVLIWAFLRPMAAEERP